MEKLTVVIPTYNERDNVTSLVERIDRALSGNSYEILFIDDNSKDGTAELAESLSTKYPVQVIVRKNERGLGSAVVHGFRHAGGEILAVIDADLQHPPEVLADMLKAVQGGSDLVIASRYVKGGSCEGWGLSRRVMSKGAVFLAHIALPKAKQVKDPMSGFFMLRKSVVEDAELKPTGYKILLEVLGMGHFKRVTEVPFTFCLREKGESKLGASEQINYLKHLFSLMVRTGELTRFFKFCLVGGSGVIVNEGLYWLLTRFAGFAPLDRSATGNILSGNLALIISIETSIVTNFILNNYFTFSDHNSRGTKSFFGRLLKFNLISIVGALIQIGMTNLLVLGLGIFDLLSLLIAIAIAFLWNYLANRRWTWEE